MKNITMFLMTKKGYSVLKAIEPKFRNLISVVVIGRDAALDDDFSMRIVDLCIDLQLEYVFRESFAAVQTEFALAISWRWLIKHPANNQIVFHDSVLPSYRGLVCFGFICHSLELFFKKPNLKAIFLCLFNSVNKA